MTLLPVISVIYAADVWCAGVCATHVLTVPCFHTVSGARHTAFVFVNEYFKSKD